MRQEYIENYLTLYNASIANIENDAQWHTSNGTFSEEKLSGINLIINSRCASKHALINECLNKIKHVQFKKMIWRLITISFLLCMLVFNLPLSGWMNDFFALNLDSTWSRLVFIGASIGISGLSVFISWAGYCVQNALYRNQIIVTMQEAEAEYLDIYNTLQLLIARKAEEQK